MTGSDSANDVCRTFEPQAVGWRSFAWPGGSFDSAFRPQTRHVEGRIDLLHPTIIAVIDGGCADLEVASACGHSYRGPDFAGSVSFVPPTRSRDVKMRDVRLTWASLSIRSDHFCASDEPGAAMPISKIGPFTNRRDPFLHAMLVELERLQRSEQLDGLYCEAMAVSAAQYIMRCDGPACSRPKPTDGALPGWRLRRIAEYLDANLGNRELRLDDVAQSVGLSTGFFHRAFKRTTGETPLAYIQRLRVERARQLLASRERSILQIALDVGFMSPSHFSRLFYREVGLRPSQYRKRQS